MHPLLCDKPSAADHGAPAVAVTHLLPIGASATEISAVSALIGSKLVSDFLTNRHVSQIQRLWTAVVADSRGILWLVGHRPDQRGAISPDTKRVLLLKLEA